jgi:hypothetical protein
MGHTVIEPRTAVREERRQANEALGRSFCKTLTELITNSDSSAKRKNSLPHTSGLVDLIFRVPKGNQLDTAALKRELQGKYPKRQITVEIVTARGHDREPREIVVVDQAQGISATDLGIALEDIGGDRANLAGAMSGRNLFGRGLSDVMRAHDRSEVQTYDGKQLSVAKGQWRDRWTIDLEWWDKPEVHNFNGTFLTPGTTGTAVRFTGASKKFHIPDPPYIIARLANFYMLRLIAADPNVELVLQQYRADRIHKDRITYDFPVAQVVESLTRVFEPGDGFHPLKVELLLARSERKLDGLGPDREVRENGLLVVDELDAVYDQTFIDPDYEKAEFLRRIFGVVRIHGLRDILDAHLNSPDSPTSPLRVDRDGFNRDHEFTKRLFDFLSKELRPCYERERKRLEESEQGHLSQETRKRIDDALKRLNKYFHQITDKTGSGQGAEDGRPDLPKEEISFFPQSTRLIVGRPRRVFLLVRDHVVADGCELVATATEGFLVQPETESIYRKTCARWSPHPEYFCVPFSITSGTIGQRGDVTAYVDRADGEIGKAVLQIADVLEESEIPTPATMEFRPSTSTGRPNRRNNLVLYINPQVVTVGHVLRVKILKRTGGIELISNTETGVEQLEVKLSVKQHEVAGQNVLRVRVPWRGTGWNQHATVEARAKIGPDVITAQGRIRLDEPDPNESGFFQRVEYDELDDAVPSKFAAGVITVNMLDELNKALFGTGATKEDARREFDRRLSRDPSAQQRLASLLLEEMSFRMLQQLFDDNKLPLPREREISAIHDEIDKHKFKLAKELYRALVR